MIKHLSLSILRIILDSSCFFLTRKLCKNLPYPLIFYLIHSSPSLLLLIFIKRHKNNIKKHENVATSLNQSHSSSDNRNSISDAKYKDKLFINNNNLYTKIYGLQSLFQLIRSKTGLNPRYFFFTILLLTFISTIKSLLRFSTFNHVSDITIIAMNSLSILFLKTGKVTIYKNRFKIFILLMAIVILIMLENVYDVCLLIISSILGSLHALINERLMTKNCIEEKLSKMIEKKTKEVLNKEKIKMNEYYRNHLTNISNTNEELYVGDMKIQNSPKFSNQVQIQSLDSEYNTPSYYNVSNLSPSYYNLSPSYQSLDKIQPFSCTDSLATSKSIIEKRAIRAFYVTTFSSLLSLFILSPLLLFIPFQKFTFHDIFALFVLALSTCLSTLTHLMCLVFISTIFSQVSSIFFKIIVFIVHLATEGCKFKDVAMSIVATSILF